MPVSLAFNIHVAVVESCSHAVTRPDGLVCCCVQLHLLLCLCVLIWPVCMG